MPYSNPILGGNELVRDAIRSGQFVSGVSGWTINRDGSAEFNDATVRGVVIVGVSPMGQVIISNQVPAELTAFYAGGGGTVSQAFIRMNPDGPAAGYFYEVAGLDASGDVYRAAGYVLPGTPSTVHPGVSQSYFPSTGVYQMVFGSDDAGDDARLIFQNTFASFAGRVVFLDDVEFDGDVTDSIGIPATFSQMNTELVSFTSQTSFNLPITFATPFPAGVTPVISTNIATGAGVAAHWSSRGAGVTNVGFTLEVYADTGAAAQTWLNIPVQWSASYT